MSETYLADIRADKRQAVPVNLGQAATETHGFVSCGVIFEPPSVA
jgi:hypothetical protein